MYNKIVKELKKYKSKEKAKVLQGFFKTGKGEYGEGDIFIGVKVPEIRIIVKRFIDVDLDEVKKLLYSNIHEERLAGVLILTYKFFKSNEKEQKKIYNFYLKNAKQINNWDLVDLSAPNIVGEYLQSITCHPFDRLRTGSELVSGSRKILYKLAKSKNLWERRISIISTFIFIRNNDFEDTLKISEILLNDEHDLIHKAVGWMLREVGKRNQAVEEKFLKEYYKIMPRTMLRYAIERFEEDLRQKYLKGKI